jgi:hypothetical protein
MLTLTSGGGSLCRRRKSIRWRAQARLAAARSVSTFGRRRILEAVMHLPFLDCDGPSDRRLCPRFVPLFGKTEPRVKLLFF